jgi:pyruvate dehydrogenase E2 component (dihydrolipoamide acetyltransferase)
LRGLPLSLSCDHRVIDGAEGARFLNIIVTLLEDPASLAG